MNQVLTLISNTQDAAVSNKIKDKYVSLLNASHCNWLNRNIALDIYFDDEAPGEILHMLEAENLDYAFQDPLTRSKKLLIADMDSTIINVECLDEIADFLGIGGPIVLQFVHSIARRDRQHGVDQLTFKDFLQIGRAK